MNEVTTDVMLAVNDPGDRAWFAGLLQRALARQAERERELTRADVELAA